ncbi:MAG: ribonuclease III [Bdellovibrionales bacterium]|nr:ribonuclease III [Bdellovibrionales bacterium]
MSVIKPGKLGVGAPARTESKSRSSSTNRQRDVWDDYASAKSQKPKKEYTRGAGNRMVPKTTRKNDLNFKDGIAPVELELENEIEPRSDYAELEEKLEITFSDKSLLARALTHRSALNIRERADYERLEFLGDAVLDLSVAHLLSDLHPEAREGELSKMRAALVNTQALAEIAKKLDIGPFIRLGRGELSSGGAERPSILADVMEAVIGAVYRDTNYETALTMIERIFGSSLHEVTPFDPKTELQEALHAAGSEPPSYLLELVEGPEHAPTFVTVVVIDGEIAGRGRGTTKKAAQQEAAAQALARMAWDAPVPVLAEHQTIFLVEALLVEQTEQQRPTAQKELPEAA